MTSIPSFPKAVEPQRIILARESRGLSQSDLARAIGIPQAKLSKMENGILEVTEDQLDRIGIKLSYPRQFFFEHVEIYPFGLNYYRKNKGIPQRIFKAIEAHIGLRRSEIEKLIRSIDISFDHTTPRCDIDDDRYGSPEVIANSIRSHWHVPRGPIKNMVELLESAGIIIFPCDFGTRAFSGIGTWTRDGVYLIFINKHMPTDRVRFTLAHELGHIIMHRLTTETMEKEADRFAGEFLMPTEAIRSQLSGLTIDKLAQLKLHWKVSMQAVLMKAKAVGAISDRTSESLWVQMGQLGYRLNEPFEYNIPIEKPTLLSEIVLTHLRELGYSLEVLATLAGLKEEEFKFLYGIKKPPKLKLVSE